jgi:ketosteroid isomerase-like protein
VTVNTKDFLDDWFRRLADTGWTAEVFLAALAPDLTWTATGTSPVSGVFHGLAEYVEGVYRPLDEKLAVWPHPTVERIIADGEWGSIEFRSEGGLGHNGTDYNMRYCWVVRVVDDRIVEVVGYYDQTKVVALFA